jgi:hypothetical protein
MFFCRSFLKNTYFKPLNITNAIQIWASAKKNMGRDVVEMEDVKG